jgi:hypothetical protein
MVEEETEVKLIANGIIAIYILFTIAAIVTGAVGVWWGVFAILIMTVLTYGIAPGYQEVILLYNYALFAILIVATLLRLADVPGMHVFLMVMVIVCPLMVIGVPIGHILYLVREERKVARALPPAKKPPQAGEKEPQEVVTNKISRGFALFCGYEKLKASRAFMLLLLRTAVTWTIGSMIVAILAKALRLW